jgi:hypothetical protein
MPPGGRDAVNECELEACGREGLDKKKQKPHFTPGNSPMPLPLSADTRPKPLTSLMIPPSQKNLPSRRQSQPALVTPLTQRHQLDLRELLPRRSPDRYGLPAATAALSFTWVRDQGYQMISWCQCRLSWWTPGKHKKPLSLSPYHTPCKNST